MKGLIISGLHRRERGLWALADDRLLIHNLVVGAGTMLAGILGVAFQSAASHQLKPADYGAVFAVVTLISFIGMPASAFALVMARETSRDLAHGSRRNSAALLRRGNRSLLIAGSAIALVLVASSPLIDAFMGTQWQLIVAAALGVPFGLALPLVLGEFQGAQRFGVYAALSAGQAAIKLVAAIALGLLLGPTGVIAGISLATIVAYAGALYLVRSRPPAQEDAAWWKPAARYLAVVLPSTLALAVLLSTDVVLVKHYFSASDAGEYSAVAALGRAIFWGASGVAAVLFPKLAFRSAKGERGSLVLVASLGLVAAGGFAALGVLSLISRWLLTAFAGHAYAGGASYLPWYALGMTFLGATAVLIATHQSRARAGFLAVLVPLVAIEPLLIAAFHRDLLQVVQVVDIAMALPAAGLTAWYLVEERTSRALSVRLVSPATAPQMEGSR